MPRNGTGQYIAPSSSWNPGVNGVTAQTTDFNALLDDLEAGLTQSVSSDGQTPMTGNLPMGNNKITGLALGTGTTDAASVANLNAVAGQAGGVGDRNLLINGNFAVNRRVYVSGTATVGGNQYTLDRWRVVTTGQSITFGAAAPDRVVTCPAGGLEQPIEAGMVAGGVYTLSWIGTATAKVNGVAITNGGNTSSLPANTQVTVQFASGTVTNAQFELGTTATPYQRRQLAVEQMLCMRYYQTSYQGVAPATPGAAAGRIVDLAASTSAYGVLRVYLSPPMRIAPATVVYNPTTGGQTIRNETAGTDFTIANVGGGAVSQNYFAYQTGTAPPASATISMHYTADAEIP